MRLSWYLHSSSRLVKMGYRQTNLERLPEMISWQGLEQEDSLIGFGAMKQQSSSMMRLRQAESTILIQGSKGGKICQKGILVQNLALKHNHNKKPSQRGFDGGYETTSRCIGFGGPVANCYAQSNSITSE
jgi:hypothetical protein